MPPRGLAGEEYEVESPSGAREKAVSDFIQIDPLCAIIIADYIRCNILKDSDGRILDL